MATGQSLQDVSVAASQLLGVKPAKEDEGLKLADEKAALKTGRHLSLFYKSFKCPWILGSSFLLQSPVKKHPELHHFISGSQEVARKGRCLAT
jgi:hypothetical protein